MEFGSHYAEARPLFLNEEEFGRLWQGPGRVFLLSDAPDRFDHLTALASTTVLLGRSGKNWLFSNRVATPDPP